MLEVRQLVKVYPGPVAALSGVDLEIPRGLFGLLGPNGSGKTTLMRILAGVLEPTSGRIVWNGDDVTDHPEQIWPRLGNLPQYFGFYPNMTGRAMLLHMLRLKGVVAPGGLQAVCDELLERVNLTTAANRRIKGYSGGMKQRLGIAQAIAGDPELIIVDEPTAGLDPEERNRFYRLLAELAETRAVLLSTHIVEDVATLCPSFAVIRHGRLLATTTPAEARRRLEGRLFEGTVDYDELQQLTATGRVTRATLFEGRYQVRYHAEEKGAPAAFTPTEATLEDAYLVMMRDAEVGGTVPAQAAP